MNNPVLNVFDIENAAALCLASRDAYHPPSAGRTFSHGDTLAFSLQPSAFDLIVGFRGTADLRNWITDLDCSRELEDGALIHHGFARALDGVEAEIIGEILTAASENRRIWLTGHSLGGALAMLFAWRFYNRFPEISLSGIYTFGQPRVGNRAFRDAYNFSGLKTRTFRIVHANDIVPRVPWLLGGYYHAGNEIFYPTVGRRCRAASGASRICSASKAIDIQGGAAAPPYLVNAPVSAKIIWDLRNTWRELHHGKLALLADHHVGGYVDILQANFPRSSTENSVPKVESSLL